MSNTCLVAQIGARMHYAVPRLLQSEGRLEHLYTDICAVKGWPRSLRALPPFFRPSRVRRLLDRTPRGVPSSRITAFTRFGGEYSRRLTRAVTSSSVTAAILWAGRTFCRQVVARGIGEAATVYTFNNAGLELMQHAHARGRVTVMEQTIAPKAVERTWLREERAAFPEWENPAAADPLLDDYIERETAEWKEADLILCGSEFVRAGIAHSGGPVDHCRVVPYGVDAFSWLMPRPPRQGPLRVLTVGAVGLRKGAPYLLAAAEKLRRHATFRTVGPIEVSPAAEARLRREMELTGPVPRSEIRAHFQWADVFLLPSLCEGSATVAYEALAAGLPVIATPNSGTVIRDKIDGFIIPPRNSESIVAALIHLTGDRTRLRDMSHKARGRSLEFDLGAYRNNLLAVLPSQPRENSR
jgi:glycosyltransferase involved in cell wall biosynthesis